MNQTYTLRSTCDPMVHEFEADDDYAARDHAVDLVTDHATVVRPRELGQRLEETDLFGFFALEQDGRMVYPGVVFVIRGYPTAVHATRLLNRLNEIRAAAEHDAPKYATGEPGYYTVVSSNRVVENIVATNDMAALSVAAGCDVHEPVTEEGEAEDDLMPFGVYAALDGHLVGFGVQCYAEEHDIGREEFIQVRTMVRPIEPGMAEWFDSSEDDREIGDLIAYADLVVANSEYGDYGERCDEAIQFLIGRGVLPEETPLEISKMGQDSLLKLVTWLVTRDSVGSLGFKAAAERFGDLSSELRREADELRFEAEGAAVVANYFRRAV